MGIEKIFEIECLFLNKRDMEAEKLNKSRGLKMQIITYSQPSSQKVVCPSKSGDKCRYSNGKCQYSI